MNLLMKALLAGLSHQGADARLSILIFHRVLPEPDPLFPGEITAPGFEQICRWLADWFNVLPLDEAALQLQQRRLPSRALAITFDDGYADNRTVAGPLLKRHGLPCTFFVATGFLDGGRMWNDTLIETVRRAPGPTLDLRDLAPDLGELPLRDIEARRRAVQRLIMHCKYLPPLQRQALVDDIAGRTCAALPDDLMMTSEQLRELHGMGMQVGAHTVNHPILARLPREQARAEILQSKQRLESIVGAPVTLFAYPNGKPGEDYSPESVALARECGFAAAVSTSPGVSNRHTDLFQLRRFTPWDRDRLRFGLRMARNLATQG
jgi:peptidoglycan/xylan/chitin deacetylase (PgdA/CDA1 family)